MSFPPFLVLAISVWTVAPPLPRGNEDFRLGMSRAQVDSAVTARALTVTHPPRQPRKETTPGPWNPAHPTRQPGPDPAHTHTTSTNITPHSRSHHPDKIMKR